MGLCKCPRKKVTNLFCYEHRVNVCETCLSNIHKKCIVQSYLQWLQDSDYSPTCQLCGLNLQCSECVRLTCYHVFHWNCLDKYARQLPGNTAPAGYTCPTCNVEIFPPNNLVSPVGEQLRGLLYQVNWARQSLGMPLIEESAVRSGPEGSDDNESCDDVKKFDLFNTSENVYQKDDHQNSKEWIHSNQQTSTPVVHSVVDMSNSSGSNIGHYASDIASLGTFTPKRLFATDSEHTGNVSYDHDENKYRRRSPLEWFGRWFRLVAKPVNKRDPNRKMKRYIMIIVLSLIGLLTLIGLMIRVGRYTAERDPFLDPMSNPNIRVDDGAVNAAIQNEN